MGKIVEGVVTGILMLIGMLLFVRYNPSLLGFLGCVMFLGGFDIRVNSLIKERKE